MTEVEHYEHMRRAHEIQGKSIREIARDEGIHRRKVRRALSSAVPPGRRRPVRERPILTAQVCAAVNAWLEADRTAPKKQRHTARRIFARLQAEHGYVGAESTIRAYVSRRRRELGLGREVFVPQSHLPGDECEVDFYEARVAFPWGEQRVFVLQFRACHSGREYHRAYPALNQQAFLDGHNHAFTWFGGAFTTCRYDNLNAAVKRVLRGRKRDETAQFVALRSHYLFESEFCRPGKQGAHEKGGVEMAVGRFRRTHLVPVPAFESWPALNRQLERWCREDDGRRLSGRTQTIAQMWQAEAPQLRPLPEEAFETDEVRISRVDTLSRISVKTHHYSVPVRLSGRRVEVRIGAHAIRVFHGGQQVAQHRRLGGRHGESLQLDHYLELLKVRPGALKRSRPLSEARSRGDWREVWDQLWAHLVEGLGEAEGTRQLLDVLMLCRENSAEEVEVAAELALEYGCGDAAGVKLLLRQLQGFARPFVPLGSLSALERFERPASGDLTDYDTLLVGGTYGEVS